MFRFIERQRYIVDFAIASLLRRKWKQLSLLAVYSLVVFVLASVVFFTGALRQEAAALLQHSPEITVQRVLTGRQQPVPVDYAEKVRAIAGVVSVRPRLWGYYYDGAFMANYTLLVPAEGAPQSGTVSIGNGISRVRQVFAGDVIGLTGYDGTSHSCRVAGVLSEESELLSADLMLINERDYRALAGLPADCATDLVVRVTNPREVTTVAEKIRRLLPDTRPVVREEILRTYDTVFGWRGGLIVVIFSSTLLSFIILAWDKATGLSAEEYKEIGVLKTVGWDTADVLQMKCWEGVAISVTAYLAGAVAAYGHVFFSSAALFAPVMKGWSTLYPTFRLAPDVDVSDLVFLFLLTVVPYTVATIVPSWRAATVDPDAVLR